MWFTPRHPQPFTLEQAAMLEIPVITQEIARLQASLERLKSTQDELKDHLGDPTLEDKELRDAYEENKEVIASQQERIVMLRLALQFRGGPAATNSHYDMNSTAVAPIAPQQTLDSQDNESGGVFL